jgi:tRNA A-37 threonylcarbamoyl transferase component Bud32/cytoskeletal protein RodZ
MAGGEREHDYEFETGQLIDDRYEVIEPLGFGGFAEVYKCRDRELETLHAVKVLDLSAAIHDVRQEARIAARIDHPSIVRVVNVGESKATKNWYIVMDYREGSRTLEAVLDAVPDNSRRLPLNEATLQIVSDVAAALDAAHSEDIVHQDVKPSNIIVDPDGRAYLTDFGLAMTKRLPGTSVKTIGAQTGMSGTIPYMSPEQFGELEGDSQIGPSTDIYSLGVVAYEMLTGQLPYRSKGPGPLIQQIVTGARVPPRLANPDIPVKVQDVLLRVLSMLPAERYVPASAFADALCEAADAYIAAENLYQEALAYFDSKQEWRAALMGFEQLEKQAPDYRDTRVYLERARHQVRLLDLYREAQQLLDRGEYGACLDQLDVLTQLEPDYVVTTVREQALSGLVARLYEQVKERYHAGELEASLDLLERIRRRDPSFADDEGIGTQARKELERKKYLQHQYDTSLIQIQEERWADAQQTLERLREEEPGYLDVETRLTMVRHIARLSGMQERAQDAFDAEEYGSCVDQLDELVEIDHEYRPDEITMLRRQAIEAMRQRAERLLGEERFEESIETLVELRKRAPYADPDGIEQGAREGIKARERRERMDALYAQATQHLSARRFEQCLAAMAEIRGVDPAYGDPYEVESRARDSWVNLMYTEALGALMDRRYQDALDLWNRISEISPRFPDSQNIRSRALQGLGRRKLPVLLKTLLMKLKPSRRTLLIIAAVVAVAAIAVGAWFVVQGQRQQRAAATATAQVLETQAAVAQVTADASTRAAANKTATAETNETATAEANETATAEANATATAEANATATAEANATATAEANATATAEANATATAEANATATAEANATATAEANATATAEANATATAEALKIATANRDASVLPAPVYVPDSQLTYLKPGEAVIVLGRAPMNYGEWFYVKTAGDVEGYAYAPYFDWPGNFDELDEIQPKTPVPTTPPLTDLRVSAGTLQIVHVWPTSVCTQGGWTAYFEVKIDGGDGRSYALYWDEEQTEYTVKESEKDVAIVQRPGHEGLLVGTITVRSGGQADSQQVSARPPNCQ